MTTCKHENADHLKPGELLDRLPFTVAVVEQFRCLDCGAYLSLGPSNDTPEVLVEIRAAEIAPTDSTPDMHLMRWPVRSGWQANKADADMDLDAFGRLDDAAGWESGWLAREIWSTP